MNMRFGEMAAFSRVETPTNGAFEWWYLDAETAGGEWRTVIIFFRGSPLSPDGIRASLGKIPCATEFSAFAISLYHHGRQLHYQFDQRTALDTRYATTPAGFTLGNPQASVEVDFIQGAATVRLACTSRVGAPVLGGTLVFRARPLEEPRGSEADEVRDPHTWNPIWPRCKVEGTLHLQEALKRTTVSFDGTGYFDHNHSTAPLHDERHAWYWGRAHLQAGGRESTVVWYAHAHRPHAATLLVWQGGVLVGASRSARLRMQHPRRHWMGLRWQRRLDLRDSGVQVLVDQHQVVDAGPFYHRFIADVTLHIPGQPPATGTAITEVMDPPRLRRRTWDVFVSMRIRRFAR